MVRGLYTSGYSMLVNQKKMDVISNNLANADTTGFKKDTVIFEAFPSLDTKRINDFQNPINPIPSIGSMRLGVEATEVFTYFTQGQLNATERSLDMAISGADNAFFTIGIPNANGGLDNHYSRDGVFSVNAVGVLVNKDGHPVLGQNGQITLSGSDISVNDSGEIFQNGEIIDRLAIAQFQDPKQLSKYGNNLLTAPQDAQTIPFNGKIYQGYTEKSNINTIREMVDMITVMRAYEANQKLIQYQDSTLDRAINSVGSVR